MARFWVLTALIFLVLWPVALWFHAWWLFGFGAVALVLLVRAHEED